MQAMKWIGWLGMCVGGLVQLAGAADVLEERLDAAVQVFETRSLRMEPELMAASAVASMMNAVDPKGMVLDAEALQAMQERLGGVAWTAGLQLVFTGEQVRVSGVLEGSSSDEIQADDLILTVAGVSVSELSVYQVLQQLHAESEQVLRLEVERDGTALTVEWPLQERRLETVLLCERLPEDIMYVSVSGLYPGSGAELTALLQAWKQEGVFGAIIDLRAAAGLDMESVQQVLNLLAAPEEPLYHYEDKVGTVVDSFTSGPEKRLALPVMLLVNEGTVGASEVLAAVCKQMIKGCMVLGTSTFGNPLVREAVAIPGQDDLLYMAVRALVSGTMRYDGRAGVRPDIQVTEYWTDEDYVLDEETTLDEELEDRLLRRRVRGDGLLSRAADLLMGLKALNIHSVRHSGE